MQGYSDVGRKGGGKGCKETGKISWLSVSLSVQPSVNNRGTDNTQ